MPGADRPKSTFDGTTTKTKTTPKGLHHTDAPPNLIAFMLKSWKPASGKMPAPIRNVANFQRRRDALLKLFPGELLVIPTGHLKVRSNDNLYWFRRAAIFSI